MSEATATVATCVLIYTATGITREIKVVFFPGIVIREIRLRQAIWCNANWVYALPYFCVLREKNDVELTNG